MEKRQPAVAGTFYPREPGVLRNLLSSLLGIPSPRGGALLSAPVGLVVPHAGYMYSGRVAGAGFRALWNLGKPQGVVIVGTNHSGQGGALCLAEPGAWETPLGAVEVDADLTQELATLWRVRPSNQPFAREHSVEVQIPFLQYAFADLPIVPVLVRDLSWGQAERAGAAMAGALAGKGWAIVASTDFTHYEPEAVAREKDGQALKALLALDGPGFLEVVGRHDISICGVGALALFLATARAVGLGKGSLLAYSTSADTGGPRSAVVGYAAALFEAEARHA